MPLKLRRCSRCKGSGLEPNTFDLPEDMFPEPSMLVDDKPRDSIGRLRTSSPCTRCDGTGNTFVKELQCLSAPLRS